MDPFRYLVGLPGKGISPAPRPLPTQDNPNTEKRRHTSMPRAGFELMISTFERPKTVLALDRSATETGSNQTYTIKIRLTNGRRKQRTLDEPLVTWILTSRGGGVARVQDGTTT
jgi:hypothetical protein